MSTQRMSQKSVISIMSACWLALLVAGVNAVVVGPAPMSHDESLTKGSAQSRDIGTSRPKATIRGRVLDADTGAPLRRAQVLLNSNELRETRILITDARGFYEATSLAPGRYGLAASKGGYVLLQFGQRRPFEPGRPIDVHDGEVLEHVDFNLPRGAAIEGHILDELGEPVADVMVMAMRDQFFAGRRRLTNVTRVAMTNDRGEFRLFGIPPGQYYVSATLRSSGASAESVERVGYAATYFPGTANIAEAERVRLSLAQQVGSVDFALAPIRTATISGAAIDSDGRPFGGGTMTLTQAVSGASFLIATGSIKPDGTFSVAGIAPGDYVVQAAPTVVTGGLANASADVASTHVSVVDGDVRDVRLVSEKPVALHGRVVVEQPARVTPSSVQLRVNAARVDDPMPQNGITWRIQDDWSFEVKIPRGITLLRLAAAPAGTGLKSVTLDGVDVVDSGMDLRSVSEVQELEVVLTSRLTEVTGTVTRRDGVAVKDFIVLAFAQDAERWQFQSRYFGSTRSDSEGRYRLRGLPPGDYFFAAVESIEQGQATDPEFLRHLVDIAAKATLGDGESKSFDLKLLSQTW